MSNAELIQLVADANGQTVSELLDAVAYGAIGIDTGICTECYCTIETEPDATSNWCPDCEKHTVKSVLILSGII